MNASVANILGLMEQIEDSKLKGVQKRDVVLTRFEEKDFEIVSDVIELVIRMSKNKNFVKINRSIMSKISGCCK